MPRNADLRAVLTSLCGLLALETIAAAEVVDPLRDPPARGFVSRLRATNWEEALISGNGTIGALLMGRPNEETIIFSHERLFMPWDPHQPVVKMAPHLSSVRRLIRDGHYREAAAFVAHLARRQGYRGMRWTDPLIPAFDLKITARPAGEPRAYARAVDFQTGVASVRWEDQRGVFVRRLFVSRKDNVAVLSLQGDRDGAVDCRITLATTAQEGADDDPHEFEREEDGEDDDNQQVDADDEEAEDYEAAFMTGVDSIVSEVRGPLLTYRSRFTKSRPDSIAGYAGAARVSVRGGSMKSTAGAIVVTDADEVLVLVTLDVLDEAATPRLDELAHRLLSLNPDFDALLSRHVQIHGNIFNRTRLDLGGGRDRRLTSEALLEKSHLGELNPALLEKLFDASRYAILSSAGELPPTLQGVWTGTWTPPWQSDYTHNGNVPSAIASMLMANMPECMESYLQYMESLRPHFRVNAEQLYGCRGIMVPSRTSSHGYNTHFDEQYMHLFWTGGAAWAAHFFYDYYLHTGDREFLQRRALPFMKEAALFFEDFLYEGPDGHLVFNPSYSPENTPANSDSQACINATMDVALVRELLTNLIAACEELATESEAVLRWQAMLRKLPDYRINQDGTVAEWITPLLEDNHGHRHVSHLCALFDRLPADIAADLALQNAFRRTIEKRMEPRRADGGGVMSFGLVQLGQAAASLGEAALAYEAVRMLSHAYWRPNLVSTHNPDSIFNVDICGGMPAVIIKMLVASSPGKLVLLPALPHQWPTGSIEGVKCRGQIEVRRLAWNDNEVVVQLQSAIEQRIEVTTPGGIESIEFEAGAAGFNAQATTTRGRTVRLPAGQPVTWKLIRSL